MLVSPGKDDLQSGPDLAWMEQLGSNLGLVLRKYSGKDLHLVNPESKDAGEVLSKPVFLVIVMHSSYKASAKYIKFLGKIASGNADAILKAWRIDTSAGTAENTPGLFSGSGSVDLFTEEKEQQAWLDEDSPLYWSKLLDLAAGLKAEEGADKGKTIYLAQPAADMIENHDILRRELMEYGFRVVPDTDLRMQKANLKSYVQDLADRSVLLIHLFGNAYDGTMAEPGISLAEAQVQYLTEYLEAIEKNPAGAREELGRLIWIDPDFDPEDSKQEEFIGSIKRNIESLHRTEIIQTPIELFKTLVIRRLRQSSREVSVRQEQKGTPGPFIYIMHSMDDQDEALELAGGLARGGILTGMLDYSKEQKDLLNDHKSYLQTCDAAVVYYGRQNRPWLHSKVMDLMKAPGFGRTHLLEKRQVLAGREDMLDDYALPSEISVIREPDLSRAVDQLLKNLK